MAESFSSALKHVIIASSRFVIGGKESRAPRLPGSPLAAGGCGAGGRAGSAEALDLSDPREWKQLPARLRVARRVALLPLPASAGLAPRGGAPAQAGQLRLRGALSASAQVTSQGPPVLESRAEFAAALIGDSVVVAGGSQGRRASACEQLLARAGSDEEARRQPPHSVTTERANHHGLSFGDYMVVIGGANPAARALGND